MPLLSLPASAHPLTPSALSAIRHSILPVSFPFSLQSFIFISRVHYSVLLPATPAPPAAGVATPLEIMHTLVLSQEAAIAHMLIELCVPSGPDALTSSVLREGDSMDDPSDAITPEVCVLACRFLHAMFVADPALVHTVHAQGYAPAALPILVRGVPSLHVVLGLLPELLQAADPTQQAFAVRAAGALAGVYPVPAALAAARACFGRLHAACFLDASSRDEFFSTALPAVPQLCAAFPLLAAPAADVLAKARHVEAARVAVTRSPGPLVALLDAVFERVAHIVAARGVNI
jgi:hypothetical protein